MANIKILKENELVGGTDNTPVYPVSSTQAIYCQDSSGNVPSGVKPRLEDRLKDIEDNMETQNYVTLNEKTIHVGNKSVTVPSSVSELTNDLGYLSLTEPIDTNGHDYVDLGLPSGALWAKCNVGATTETDYGGYYQFGKGSKTYSESWREGQYASIALDLSVDTARVVMGGNWQTSPRDYFTELLNNTTHQWVTNYNNSGINGYTFTANNQTLFIPAAGSYVDDRDKISENSEMVELSDVGTKAVVFTSTYYQLYGSNGVPIFSFSEEAYAKQFSSSGTSTPHISYSNGCSIRGIIIPQKSAFKTDLDSSLNAKANSADVYTKNTIDNMLENIRKGEAVIVDELPEASDETLGKTYLVPRQDSEENNIYDEYISIITQTLITPSMGGGISDSAYHTYAWEKVGSTEISLSDYYTKTETNTLLGAKQDTINDLSTIRDGATAGATAYQKPNTGIPKNDLVSSVQSSLNKADSAYQKPSGGIPSSDMTQGVQESLAKAESALQDDTLYFDSNGNNDYIEIGGVKWATKNLGASSTTDAGLYFQWGDVQGYTAAQAGVDKTFNFSDYKYTNDNGTTMTKYSSTDSKTVLDASDDAAVSISKGTWRMPTKEDFQALAAACTVAWTSDYNGTGVKGVKFVDSTNANKVLFFPATGKIKGTTYYEGASSTGMSGINKSSWYWTKSVDTSDNSKAVIYEFSAGIASIGGGNQYYDEITSDRGYGSVIRPILDNKHIKKDLDSKADKVEEATSGDIAVLTSDGNLSDSGVALSGFQTKLTTQTAYNSKGSATKVPQITTNTLGQVTNITEVDIAARIQSDWNQSDNSSLDYIKNKPNVVTSTTSGLKIEVVAALPANPDSSTIYIVQ